MTFVASFYFSWRTWDERQATWETSGMEAKKGGMEAKKGRGHGILA